MYRMDVELRASHKVAYYCKALAIHRSNSLQEQTNFTYQLHSAQLNFYFHAIVNYEAQVYIVQSASAS